MSDNSNQPKPYDLVLGGNNAPPINSGVLGGIEGVKRRLANDNVEIRIAALKDALKYDDEGLSLIIAALEEKDKDIQINAYKLLYTLKENRAKKAIQSFNPYRFLKSVCKLELYIRGITGSICIKDNLLYIYGLRNKYTIERQIINLKNFTIISLPNKQSIRFGLNSDNYNIFHSMLLSKDAQILMTAGNRATDRNQTVINIFNIHTEKMVQTFSYSVSDSFNRKTALAISDCKQIFASSSSDKIIHIWNLARNKKHIIQHSQVIVAFSFSPDGKYLMSLDDQGNIASWNTESGQQLNKIVESSKQIFKEAQSLNVFDQVNGYRLNCDRNILVTCKRRHQNTKKTITKIWNITENKFDCLAILPEDNASSAFISSDGQVIVSCHNDRSSDIKKLKVWGIY